MSLPAILAGFLVCAAIVALAGTSLARNGDVIAARTSLGGLWVGSIFVAIATSLPEITTDVSAILMGLPDLAAGDLFGSSMANMLILGMVSLLPGADLFRRAALDNAASAALAIVVTSIAAIALLIRPDFAVAGIGPGALVILVAYLVGTRAIYLHTSVARAASRVVEMSTADPADTPAATPTELPRSLQRALVGFAGAAAVILLAAPLFVVFAERLAAVTGLESSFIGTWLVGMSTSLPELVTSAAAVRLGAYDLAIGNLFGSNAVNMLLLVPLDALYRDGPILAAVHPVHAVTALTSVVLMAIGLAAIVFRSRGRLSVLEPDSGLLVLGYVVGIWIIYWVSGSSS